ncbi:MAG: hypothetical protein Q4A78_12400 [Peptostreptococcaceae bacterium]|nr:hypothetical protein [Peptostreptococcaceae bacterium]
MTKRKAVYNPEADARWREKNRERANYLRRKSSAKSFIRLKATMKDIEEIEEVIEERRKFLEQNENHG